MLKSGDFLRPESMLTPGIAGGIAIMIANTLWASFALEPKWTALLISFLLGLIVFKATQLAFWQRSIYYVLNSLIIFSVATGANFLGTPLSNRDDSHDEASVSAEFLQPLASFIFSSPCYAGSIETPSIQEEPKPASRTLNPRVIDNRALSAELITNHAVDNTTETLTTRMRTLRDENKRLRDDLERERQQRAKEKIKRRRPFFKKW